MTKEIKHKKIQFWMNWIFLSFAVIPVSYMISLIVVLLIHGAFGFSQMEGGTYLSQTVMQIGGGAVIGLGAGIYQRLILQRVFNVKSSWIYTMVIGFAITELIVCIVLWQLKLNRYELRFIEFRPIPEAMIFACIGLIIGLLQWTILRRYFRRSFFWVLASTLGWGISVLVTQISIWAFFLGALLYGAVTGATLMWILRKKKEDI
jgi:hypothetical protein